MILSPKLLSLLTVLNSIGILVLGLFLLTSNIPSTEHNTISSKEISSTTEAAVPKEKEFRQESSAKLSSEHQPPKQGASSFTELLEQTIEPLRAASSDHNEMIELPSEEEIAAAVESRSLDSEATKRVLQKLEVGYQRYNMPFPSLQIPEEPQEITEGSSGAPSTALEKKQDGEEIKAWLTPTLKRIKEEIKSNGEREFGLVPTEAELNAAIRSSSWNSEETRLVMDSLKASFARFKLAFPDPQKASDERSANPTSSSSMDSKKEQDVTSSVSSTSSSKQKILAAYFKGQLQRVNLEANSQSKDIASGLPSQSEIDAAVATASLGSEESQKVLEKIEALYTELNIVFYAPPVQD